MSGMATPLRAKQVFQALTSVMDYCLSPNCVTNPHRTPFAIDERETARQRRCGHAKEYEHVYRCVVCNDDWFTR
jgi:hypothetical protein